MRKLTVVLTTLMLAGALPGYVVADTVATVNGTEISDDMIAALARARLRKEPDALTAQEKTALTDELIQLTAIATAAEKAKLHKDPDVAMQIELQRRSLLAQAMMARHLEDNPVSESQLQQAYDGRYGAPGREFSARHILVESPETAMEIITKLDQGGDFSALAAEYSIGPTASSGGDLGWFAAGQMVKPFSDAVAAMDVGSHTSEPVQTRFGWHVIRKEDERDVPAPDLESVRQELQRQLQQQRVQAFVQDMRSKARIKQN